jgi:hypothetical protein
MHVRSGPPKCGRGYSLPIVSKPRRATLNWLGALIAALALLPVPAGAQVECSLGPEAVRIERREVGADGNLELWTRVTNSCSTPRQVMLDLVGRERDGDRASRPLAAAPTVLLTALPPGESPPVALHLPIPSAPGLDIQVLSLPADARATCLDVGATRCLSVAPILADAVLALRELPDGQPLLRNAADRRVRIRSARLDSDLRGLYSPISRVITVSRRLERRAVQVRAVILAHELQHATEPDDPDETVERCFQSEEAAFRVEARIWSQLWRGAAPPDVDGYHRDANRLVSQLADDPDGFAREIRDLYEDDCAGDDDGD